LIHSDGDIYEGEWQADKAHGHVILNRLHDRAHTFIWTELNMLVNGLTTNRMEKVKKYGQMVPVIKVSIFKEKNMEEVSSSGLMVPYTKENSSSITFRAQVFTNGLMVVNTKENGRITRWMEKGY